MAIYLSRKFHPTSRYQEKTVTAGTSRTVVTPDRGYDALYAVNVDPTPSQSKSATIIAGRQGTQVIPDAGKLLSEVSVDQPVRTDTCTPTANTAQYDMGVYNNYRYVNTSGMIVPSGNKILTYTTNGMTSDIDVREYAGVTVVRSISLAETTLWTNSSPTSSFSGDITVSNFSSYDYIKIYFRYSTSLNETSAAIFPITTFYNNYCGFGMRKSDSSTINDMKYRCCYVKSYTTVNFANSVSHQSASQTTSGAYIIPTKITGLKLS